MRAQDLDLRDLLSFEPKGGEILFAGRRAIILDTVALGLLRKELIDTLGVEAARGVLARYGYAHGWRTAETLRDTMSIDDGQDLVFIGGVLHSLQGIVFSEAITRFPVEGESKVVWHGSYEAEQHLVHFGRSDEPVCWTLCGYASGYNTLLLGRECYCVEERCVARGDPVCIMRIRPKEAFGAGLAEIAKLYERDLDGTLARVTRALKDAERKLRRRRQELESARAQGGPDGLAVHSAAMRQVVDRARRAAQVDSTVLVTGESGVGKERLARLLHAESRRAAGPFVGVNCAAVPEGLVESELFGHARGAFTGAASDRAGLFEAAHSGTLFLDEVTELPLAAQGKLLRVLQDREVRRVGENRARPVDVRIVAATNSDVGADVRSRRFRHDLYYRLKVVELRIPPLRERSEDILPLARLFLSDARRRHRRRSTSLTPRAAERLLRHSWPGNVRELQNAMEQAVALSAGGPIDVADLPDELREPPALRAAAMSLAEVERDHILACVEAHGGNRAKAARQLGIGEATLYRRLRSYRSRRG